MSELALLSKPVLMRRLALVPAVASASLAANRQGAFDTPFEYSSGLEALPIGGLTGTIPSPTLGQPQADIRAGRFHLVWIATDTDPPAEGDRHPLLADVEAVLHPPARRCRLTAPGAQRRMKHDDGAARTTGWPTR